jgi:pyrroloquinoline-quinone synthase
MELLGALDDAIRKRSLLKHPFYQDWQAGTLSRPKLLLYAQQYYLHVEAFPDHLKVVAARAEGDLRELVLENLADEEDPMDPHAKLWRDFASAVGVNGAAFWTSVPLPGIQKLIDTYRQICREGSLGEAVASLYAYEAQVPEISMTKMEGLRRYYGVTTRKGLAYFRVHEEADRAHRAAWRRWLENSEYRTGLHDGTDEERILTAARRSLSALWEALDSVQEAGA